MSNSGRVASLSDAEMNDEQRAIAADIAGSRRGVLGGPFALWLRIPEVAKRISAVSDRLRKGSTFDKRIVELIVLIVTSDWKAQYAWTAHASQAIAEGIAPDAVEAIRTKQTPHFTRDDEQLIYDIFSQLSGNRTMDEATYARGITAFGLDGMIELVTTAGLYTMISMMLVSFDVPTTTGEHPFA